MGIGVVLMGRGFTAAGGGGGRGYGYGRGDADDVVQLAGVLVVDGGGWGWLSWGRFCGEIRCGAGAGTGRVFVVLEQYVLAGFGRARVFHDDLRYVRIVVGDFLDDGFGWEISVVQDVGGGFLEFGLGFGRWSGNITRLCWWWGRCRFGFFRSGCGRDG